MSGSVEGLALTPGSIQLGDPAVAMPVAEPNPNLEPAAAMPGAEPARGTHSPSHSRSEGEE